jgi:hypothetical protein
MCPIFSWSCIFLDRFQTLELHLFRDGGKSRLLQPGTRSYLLGPTVYHLLDLIDSLWARSIRPNLFEIRLSTSDLVGLVQFYPIKAYTILKRKGPHPLLSAYKQNKMLHFKKKKLDKPTSRFPLSPSQSMLETESLGDHECIMCHLHKQRKDTWSYTLQIDNTVSPLPP